MRDKGDFRCCHVVHFGCRLILALTVGAAVIRYPAYAQARGQGPSSPFDERGGGAQFSLNPIEMPKDQALWSALAFEDNEMLRQLLKDGANPNSVEALSRMTPLMAAETLQLAWTLIESGASPKAKDRMGRTPLHYAVKMRDAQQIVPLLVRAGADINARTAEPGAITPLFFAIENYLENPDKDGASQVLRVMMRYGADIGATDSSGATVLAIAAANNRPDLIKLLIELGADPSRRLGNGRVPLDYAREANAVDVIRLLGGATSGTVSGN